MATDSTAVTHWIPNETIDEALGEAHYAVPVMVGLMDTDAVGKGKGPTVRLTRIAATTVNAGTKTEDAEFTIVDQASGEETVAAGTVGATYRPTYEADYDSIHGAIGPVIQNGGQALLNRVDTDACALFPSLTNIGNFTLQPLTDNRVLSAIAVFHLLNPNALGKRVAGVLSAHQVRDYAQDLSASGAAQLGGDIESARVAELFKVGLGFKGVRHGIEWYLDNNVSLSAGDARGAIFVVGKLGALALRSWRGITVEQDPIPRRQSVEITVSARYGVTIRDQSDGIRLVSRGT